LKDGKLDILLVDDNRELCDVVTDYIDRLPDMRISAIAHDGREALDLLEKVKPDCMILDIIMPNLDGLEVLEQMHRLDLTTELKTIVLSIAHQDSFIQNAFQKGSDYYLIKPVGLDILEKKIREVCADIDSRPLTVESVKKYHKGIDVEEELTNILRIIGVPFSVKGFQFIIEAVLMVLEERNLLSSITTNLYPTIAKNHNTTASRVERAIRHAIETTWSRGNLGQLELLFGSSSRYTKSRPANGEFIAVLAEKLRLKFR
jgi:two-component system, response regulator, stage 0 sporulation protein A